MVSVAAAAAVLLVTQSVAPAEAASGDRGTINNPASFRSCPDTRCGVTATIPKSTQVAVSCWRDAGLTQGSVRWFRVVYNGRQGYVHSSLVSNQPSVPVCSSLIPDETLWAGQQVYSQNGSYRLAMQTDGNLVLYTPSKASWATMTDGTGADRVIMQSDGNLVVYRPTTGAAWASMMLVPGQTLEVQPDGNLVAYAGSTAEWASSWHTYRGQATRTNNAGVAGNCTWYANDQWQKYWLRHQYPALTGDAGNWNDSAAALGYDVGGIPTTHSIVVFEANTNGTGSAGHVAWVESVTQKSDGTHFQVSEMNWAGNFNRVTGRDVKFGPRMSFIPAPKLP